MNTSSEVRRVRSAPLPEPSGHGRCEADHERRGIRSRLPLGCLPRRAQIVLVLHSFARRAHLDTGDPRMFDDVLDEDALLRVRFEHLPDQGATLAGFERRYCRRATGRAGSAGQSVGCVELIAELSDTPRDLVEVHAIVHDAAGPDVDQSGIIRCWGQETARMHAGETR